MNEWFENNHMKPNKVKCHLWVSGYKHENVWASIEQIKIWESAKPKLLGAEIDRSLMNMFDYYIRKLEKRKKACPLVLIFLGRTVYKQVNHMHERSLQIFYTD